MAKAKVYNLEGRVMKEIDLDDRIFSVNSNIGLVQQVVVAQQSASRYVFGHSKDKSQVRGGGKKPWKQKGTGRARHGSIRSPLWRGGGVTFGPTIFRNFLLRINKKMKRKALFMALSEKFSSDSLVVTEVLSFTDYKTNQISKVLNNLPLGNKVLMVLPKTDLNIWRAVRNLGNVQVIVADSLNVIDVLKAKTILVPEDSLGVISSVYLKK